MLLLLVLLLLFVVIVVVVFIVLVVFVVGERIGVAGIGRRVLSTWIDEKNFFLFFFIFLVYEPDSANYAKKNPENPPWTPPYDSLVCVWPDCAPWLDWLE